MSDSSKYKWFSSRENMHNVKANAQTDREKDKFINTCKNPIKILQFMAVKQVYLLESLEISHLKQIIWCFMNYQSSKRQILKHSITFYGGPDFHIHLRSYFTAFDKSESREILFCSVTGRNNGTGNCKEIHLSFLAIM